MRTRLLLVLALAVVGALGVAILPVQGQLRVTAASSDAAEAASDLGAALDPEDWRRVDEGVERALAWLAQNQQADGSFPSLDWPARGDEPVRDGVFVLRPAAGKRDVRRHDRRGHRLCSELPAAIGVVFADGA